MQEQLKKSSQEKVLILEPSSLRNCSRNRETVPGGGIVLSRPVKPHCMFCIAVLFPPAEREHSSDTIPFDQEASSQKSDEIQKHQMQEQVSFEKACVAMRMLYCGMNE